MFNIGGFDVIYDVDGFNLLVLVGVSDFGGVCWVVEFGKDDIIGFNLVID